MLNEAKRGSLVDDRDRSFKGWIKGIIPWKGDGVVEIIRKLVFIAAVGYLIFWVVYAYNYNFGSKSMIEDNKTLAELFTNGSTDDVTEPDPNVPEHGPDTPSHVDDQPGSELPEKPEPVMLQNFQNLYNINPDIAGWISIDGITLDDGSLAINYPVVQNGDNDYYLEHDFYGAVKEYGALFVDYRADIRPDTRSSNITIYGHNMKAEAYFHHLRDYNRTSASFVSDHRIVNFTSLYSEDKYIIIGCFLVSVNEEDDNQPLFPYHNCVEFNTLADFDYWYKNMMYRNYYTTDIECDMNDEYLTLSTCSFEIGDARFVVVARKLHPGEDPEQYTYESNKKRHMPKKYLTANGLKVTEDDGPDYEYYQPPQTEG